MVDTLTFDQLPTAVNELNRKLDKIERLLIEKNDHEPTDPHEQPLTIQEAAGFLSLTVPTMYSKVSKGEVPVMKRGKRLYFSRADLNDYLKGGRKKTNAEIEAEASEFLVKRKG